MISKNRTEQFTAWSDALGCAIQATGTEDFYPCLCRGLAQLPDLDYPVVLYFPQGEPPLAIHSQYVDDDYRLHIERYIAGPYILDPYYRLSMDEHSSGLFRLKDIAPDNFKRSEFYQQYYKAIKAEDELSFVQTLSNGDAVHISINHQDGSANFSRQMVQFLSATAPIIIALTEQHWAKVETKPSSSGQSLHQELTRGLALFGSSLLTEREQATLSLVLQGHSNQSAAERLGISISTIKLHRKHIYSKFDISSQSELFHLFIDCLTCLDPNQNNDPLSAYMHK